MEKEYLMLFFRQFKLPAVIYRNNQISDLFATSRNSVLEFLAGCCQCNPPFSKLIIIIYYVNCLIIIFHGG